jgi:LytS/YehU family sensor histidine kinase
MNPKGHGLKDVVGGIGLQNVQRRLALLYPDKHTLKINDTDNHFTINLELINE